MRHPSEDDVEEHGPGQHDIAVLAASNHCGQPPDLLTYLRVTAKNAVPSLLDAFADAYRQRLHDAT
jgi:hypothetical protein